MLDKINKRDEFWIEADRMDKAYAWTYNRLTYAITDETENLQRFDRGEWLRPTRLEEL